jgi:hypothetical protein
LPLLAFAAWLVVAIVRGDRKRARESPGAQVAALTAPLVAAPLIVFTVGVLVADFAKTESWTLTRQNVETLRGELQCGLADETLVADAASVRPLEGTRPPRMRPVPEWVTPPPTKDLPRFVLGPPVSDGPASTPWFELPADARVGLFMAGSPGPTDRLVLEWGRRHGNRIETLEAAEVFARFEPQPESATVPWAFLAASELPTPAAGSTLVRIALRSSTPPGEIASGAVVAVTAPVTYSSESLARKLEGETSRSLILANLLTYFPCAKQPLLDNGVVDVPANIVSENNSIAFLRDYEGSPFRGLLDLYPLRRESLADSEDPPATLSVFSVDAIPGAVVAPPDLVSVRS